MQLDANILNKLRVREKSIKKSNGTKRTKKKIFSKATISYHLGLQEKASKNFEQA